MSLEESTHRFLTSDNSEWYNLAMAAIELDDQTAQELQRVADALGVSVESLVRTRVLGRPTPKPQDDGFDFDAELDKLVTAGPPLPADFSRSDIYSDDF